jgi:hypothetical protein
MNAARIVFFDEGRFALPFVRFSPVRSAAVSGFAAGIRRKPAERNRFLVIRFLWGPTSSGAFRRRSESCFRDALEN